MPGNEVAITIRTIDETTKGTQSSVSNLKKLGTVVTALGASLVGMGITVKKVFDWGEQGAAITQTRESFELFLEKVDVAPDLLDRLREASRGTIKDVDLMSSTMTLAAGAEEDLAKSLIDATPRLMEIAKAANKLNPALGDTAFMYQSIATGVKRASPLILDNLGLTIKVGEANEKYAAIHGKVAKNLTTTEQKMALLNATMEAGDTLIAQAGGTTESATDAYSQLKVQLGEVFDVLKIGISEAILPAVNALTEFIRIEREGAQATKERVDEMWNSVDGMKEYVAHLEQLAGSGYGQYKGGYGAVALASAQARLRELEFKQTQQDLHALNKDFRNSLHEVEGGLEAVGTQAGLTAEEIEELAQAQIKELNYLIGVDFEDTLQDHEATMEDLQIQYDTTKKKIDELIAKYGGIDRIPSWKLDEWVDLQNELGKTRQKIDEEEAAWKRNTQQILFNMAARALEALPIDVQSEALGALAESMGLIDEPTREAWENIGTLTQMLGEGKIDAEEYGTLIDNLGVHLTNLPEEVSPDVVLTVTGLDDLLLAVQVLRQLGIKIDIPVMLPEPERRQFGGPVRAGGSYWVGEAGPELFIPPQSGTITPVSQYGPSTGSLSIGSIVVHVGEGTDGRMIVDEIMAEMNRRVQQANISGSGYVGI